MKKSFIASLALIGFFVAGLNIHAAEMKAGSSQKAPAAGPKSNYEAKCASCHGKDGKGNAALAKALKLEPASMNLISKEVLAKKDEDLIAITNYGKGKMPPYKNKLTEADIKALVEYVRSLGEVKK